MKYLIVIISIIILWANPSIGQNILIKGKFIDYKTSEILPGVSLSSFTLEGEKQDVFSGYGGTFELKMNADAKYLVIRYMSSYVIKILNIPSGLKQIDFGEIKIVKDFDTRLLRMDGCHDEASPKHIDNHKRYKKEIIEKYRLKVKRRELKPYFEGKDLIFDFNQGTCLKSNGEK
ncbi:hypothetical protein EYV94_15350 [Puteibacter caeruleilacunae]|nr:hypothetical protein EYV94_15350 [Puteibacter caeruleilacunae]